MVRLAKENSSWGYTKIRDVMFTLGHKIGRTTVRRILAEDGIEPAPERRKHMPWATFLKAHWGTIAAMDFFKVEVMTLFGPVRYSVLVVMDLKTRHVKVARVVREAYEEWMVQVLRNLTDVVDGFLLGKTHVRHLIHEYIAHYHVERPHQGLGAALIQPANDQASDGRLVKRKRLGGLLNYYHREAA